MESLASQNVEQFIPLIVTALLSTGFIEQLKKYFPWMSSTQLRFAASFIVPFSLGFGLSYVLSYDIGSSVTKGFAVYAMSSGAYLIGKDKVKPTVLTEQLSTQPESIDLAVGLGAHLETLPSGDSGQEILTPAINYLLDKTLPDVVAEAGVLAKQKGETNEGN